MISMTISGQKAAFREVEAEGQKAGRIVRSELNRTARWLTGRAARAIAQEHQIPLKALTRGRIGKRGRVRTSFDSRTGQARVWIGTIPVPGGYLGRLRQTPTGTRAGRHFFEGAFVATMKSGHSGPFKRRGSARLPIEEQRLPLRRAEYAVSGLEGQALERFEREVQRRLERGT